MVGLFCGTTEDSSTLVEESSLHPSSMQNSNEKNRYVILFFKDTSIHHTEYIYFFLRELFFNIAEAFLKNLYLKREDILVH